MDNTVGMDWGDYFHRLSDNEIHELATWLAAECLEVWEFTDIVDRAYAQASDDWHERQPAFVASRGRPAVEGYARRKRRFVELTTAHDEARLRGALPGDVTPEELRPLRSPKTEPRSVDDLLSALERARDGSV